MGAIKGFFLVLVAVLLFISLLLVNLFYTLSLSMQYDTLQKESAGVIKDSLEEVNLTRMIGSQYPAIQMYCQNNSEFVFSVQGYTFDIPCSVALQGQDAILEEGAKDLVHNLYYTQYDCDFFDCFGQSQSGLPLFLVSEETYDFFTSNLYLLLAVSAILVVLSFFLIEKKANLPILIGSILLISSLPFFRADYLFSLSSNQMIFRFLRIFFSQAYNVSITDIIIGASLIIAGIILNIFKIGMKVSETIEKEKEKEDKTIENKPEEEKAKKKRKRYRKSKSK